MDIKLNFPPNKGKTDCNRLIGEKRTGISKTVDIFKERYHLSQTCINDINEIIEALESYKPGEWDFGYTIDGGNIPYVLVYYPDITITNRDGFSHNIKDIFVAIRLEFYMTVKIGCLYGTRASMTVEEIVTGYQHSHLPYNINDYHDVLYGRVFCLGSKTPILDAMSYISQRHFESNDISMKDAFVNLLVHIDSLLTYESLEGNPYKRMEDIFLLSKTKAYVDNHDCYVAIDDLMKNMNLKNEEVECDLYYDNGRIRICNNNKFHNWATKVIKETYKYSPGSIKRFCCVIREGKPYEISKVQNKKFIKDSLGHPITGEMPFTMIGNKKIEFKVLNPEVMKNIPEEKIVLHPYIVKGLIQFFENRIYAKQIKKEITKREYYRKYKSNNSSNRGSI